ncbi:unnamed protein product [Durusdinium trenchii]|uniref:Uncharacterized protein n=1 Tax=Durusdinium trenchii TaxID=1381693 RepID=A0ABP0R455_9DINO
MERLQRMAARREKREEARKEREAREAEHEPGFEEARWALLGGSPHSPLSAWLSPKNGTPSEQSWTPKASRSPKRLAFLEPESSSIQILQAPSRRVRKLSNSRSAPAIARCS